MLRRILHWIHNRPRRLRRRIAARALIAAFPELLTIDPVKEIKNWILDPFNWIP